MQMPTACNKTWSIDPPKSTPPYTSVPISTSETPYTSSTLSISLPSTSSCTSHFNSHQQSFQDSGSQPCSAPSSNHWPAPAPPLPVPSALHKKVSWLGDDDSLEDQQSGSLGSASTSSPAPSSPKIKRKRGRPAKSGGPRRQRGKNIPLIWDFIRNLLDQPATQSSLVCWEDREQFTFRVLDSTGLAKAWGKLKGSNKMTYEKFSRALRYHHKSKRHAMEAVPGRLIFKFSPEAMSQEPRTSG